ncbi:MAG: glycosyltransferase family 39 protein [Chloroflexota bacterium]|nr:glycosyltransferase family 39 protein [Chloroflexota bacterium]
MAELSPSVRSASGSAPPALEAMLNRPAVAVPLEWLLYGVAIVVAAGLRLGLAASDPLSLGESATALAALDLTLGRPAGSSAPLADLLTALVFFLATPSDLAARFPSVVAGTATVALMPAFRPFLGRLAALLAAFLLAVSPFSLAISRRGEPDALALLAAVVALLGLLRFERDGQAGWAATAILAFAMLLTSGPRAVTLLLAAAVALVIARLLGTSTPLTALLTRWRTERGQTPSLGGAVLAALLLFLLVSTRFFLDPSGLALPAVNGWVREFTTGGSALLPLLALVSYDPLTLGAGTAGILWLLSGRAREPRSRQALAFLALWSGVALAVAVLGGQRLVGPLAAIAFPLALLAATALADVLCALRRDDLARGAALLGAIPLLVYAYIQSAVLTRSDGGTPLQWLAVFLSLALAGGYSVLVVASLGRNALPVTALAGAALLLMGSIHASFALNARPSAGEWVLPDVPGPAAQIFPEQIAELRAARGGIIAYGVAPELRVPFAWLLRDQPGMRMRADLAGGLDAAIVPVGTSLPETAASGIRSVYALGSYGPPEGARSFWRWYVWRTAGETGFRREALLVILR